ncbi:hypothetical protein J2I47_15215 [Fibrella sp. HMF5335]|uniref:Virulence-protein E N-terminal domain-containing protein n=1 Tax=Fibrella rubiginis TaxID=2817060 RepID=A0A939GGH1_9BACT|nr:BT4734/BF3469 family protein [Fibrella rubiginis]MBO0937906.1 hypothetical protein [Fibrella rubiginis]
MQPAEQPAQHRPNWLDLPISFFEYDQQRGSFATIPTQQTTLRRIATTGYYRPLIEAIRNEANATEQSELKKQLPAISPVSLMYHRRRDTSFAQKIKQQWPLLMGDIDRKENPGVDMAQLKSRLTLLPYVLVCAHSVRGGIWFVIRLPDEQTPDTLAAHFRYLQRLFRERFGIELDKSKGGNPTDLRFVSYDPAPYLNDGATVMYKTYTSPKPQPGRGTARPVDYSRFRGHDEGELLTRLVRRVGAAAEGNRHDTLLKESRLAGGYIAAGRMNEQTTVWALETVASEWPTFTKSQKTIRDGIRYGMANPIYADEAPHPPPAPTKPAPLVVRTFAEWGANPGSILRPDECQLERLSVEPCDHYPAEWDG